MAAHWSSRSAASSRPTSASQVGLGARSYVGVAYVGRAAVSCRLSTSGRRRRPGPSTGKSRRRRIWPVGRALLRLPARDTGRLLADHRSCAPGRPMARAGAHDRRSGDGRPRPGGRSRSGPTAPAQQDRRHVLVDGAALMPRRSAIWALPRPSATRPATSRCRVVRAAGEQAVDGRGVRRHLGHRARQLGAGRDAEGREHPGDVRAHGVLAESEPAGDLAVARPSTTSRATSRSRPVSRPRHCPRQAACAGPPT